MKHTLDWNIYLKHAAQAAAEGIVMLENKNDALPLAEKEQIALFGRIQMHYYKSGTGSGGMVNVSKVVGIPEGLEAAGITLYAPLRETYCEWEKAHPFDNGTGWGGEPWAQEEMPLEEHLVADAAAHCQRAVVVIGRTAGEEQDNRMQKGSYLLTDGECEMLRLTRKYFEKVIVLLNTGNIIDMHFVDDYAPDAVLYLWQGGMTGGTGAADVLTGAVSPCGKLPDTIAYDITDYPSHRNFGDENDNIYQEDIYIGYRYFETFAKERVRYPFGYGLSYTTFSVAAELIGGEDEEIYAEITVTNTGVRPGKEVVQVYCEVPQGKLGSPSRQLIAFFKTDTLQPGASQSFSYRVELPASYDDSGITGHAHCWVREIGLYKIYVGSDVRSAESLLGMIALEETEVVAECRQAMAPVKSFSRMRPIATENGIIAGEEAVPLLAFDEAERRADALPEEWKDAKQGSLQDVFNGKLTLQQFIAQFTNEELAQIVRGEGMGSPRVTAGTASAFGGVTAQLEAYGIPAACCSDGPSGMRLDCGTKAFSLPNGTLLASTFNEQLMTDLFTCVGMEMSANHVDCLLGPGMNIHRHPLNGRNFEYFSEDPLLTGKIAAAELRGLHQVGVTGTIKHCCGNNQETRRHFLNDTVSERALREIYLKGFEIAVREGNADSIMTTYGSVNGLWTAGNYDLCTEIIRREWQFKGILMTDWWANINERGMKEPDASCLAAMVRAQNDLYMVCADCADHEDNIMAALEEGTLTRGELQRCAANICGFLLHTNAMRRAMGENHEPEVLNRPAEETDSGAPVIFYELNGDMEIPLEDICTDQGTSHAFALTVNRPGWYLVTLTASSTQSPLAQMPVTLFSMSTASGTFTWNGTNGEPVSFSNELPIYSHFTTMRLYFAQSGLKMERIQFHMLHDQKAPTELLPSDET
ncbi:MAG: glycoside hydrolase family 3 C-terminal domain-containing protein [Oscillospiraceae bacterium]|nr:glycoside hydrolase family 3 C-terminal domain-containing protein [Oscillospiraceae bacterium]